MATKKEKNLKGMTEAELLKKLSLLEESVRAVKFKSEGSRSKNVKELASFRKDIARILTEINRIKRQSNK